MNAAPSLTHPTSSRASLVIFDCDGVLVDSESLAVRTDVRFLSELGWEIDEKEAASRFIGASQGEILRQIRQKLGDVPLDDWAARFESHLLDLFESDLRPIDGIEEALMNIDAPVCVASGSSRRRIMRSLEIAGLESRFAGRIFSAEDVERGKPHPDLFLHAAATLGTSPSDCMVVEDSVHGVTAARAAGMSVLAFANPYFSRADLEGTDTVVFHAMSQLPTLLQASRVQGSHGHRPDP